MKKLIILFLMLGAKDLFAYTLVGSSVSIPVPISVRQCGAKGDGVTNDNTAITQCLALARDIFFPRGTYLTTGNHTITNQTLSGDGMGTVTIKRTSGSNTVFTVTGSGKVNDMTLDGNSLGGSLLIYDGSSSAGGKNLTFKNVAGSTYAVQMINSSQYLRFENLNFLSSTNFGNIYIHNGAYYSSFYKTTMTGGQSSYSIKFETGCTDVDFYETYTESPFYLTTTGLRDIRFTGVRVRLDQMPGAWWQSINTTGGGGGEAAQIQLNHVTVFKNVNISSWPIFDLNSYQVSMQDIHIMDSVSSSGWSVLKDRGTNNLTLKNWEVESQNSWLLFSTDTTGGFNTYAENVNWTQGVRGQASWGNPTVPGDESSNHITVINSNLDQFIATSTLLAGGFSFSHIRGNVNLTQSTGTNSLFDITLGTVSDPNHTLIGSSIISISTSITIGLDGTFQNFTSTTIPSGNWSISGFADFNNNGAVWTRCAVAISSISAPTSGVATGSTRANSQWASSALTPIDVTLPITPLNISVPQTASLTTYYLKGFCSFTAGNPTVLGNLTAVRLP